MVAVDDGDKKWRRLRKGRYGSNEMKIGTSKFDPLPSFLDYERSGLHVIGCVPCCATIVDESTVVGPSRQDV